ncbi:hypothetical protein A8924_6253 [Saccharopolyspora erythraea NRRL 2338]|uniref:Uncharacterized protein n=2 Tax=Saccharopolyspora erythraea TaxID=1836 RepID=A4FM17_SACEN|nr:hypothetical protein A8924_6253 [Saccharopolyspora erythraea NRRL 2338]QRK88738.1 hypothetical protein JQX30_29595 [Saccharopolyspora erythraea]CAM05092.1 hypothetical protein SACE_5909 [Saccharopolyspora erythraea NRRL 2338]
MDAHGMHATASDVDALALVLRLVLLSGTALVAGTGLLRPVADAPARWVSWTSGGLAALASLVSIPALGVSPAFAVGHAVLVLAVPALLRRPTAAAYAGFATAALLVAETASGHSSFQFLVDTAYTAVAVGWFGFAVHAGRLKPGLRLGPIALTAAIVLTAAAVGQLLLSGLLDRRLYGSGHGVALLLITLSTVVVLGLTGWLRRDPRRIYRFGAAGVAAVFLLWGALPAIPRPHELPLPGVPRLVHAEVEGQKRPMLITPQRPGPNLVHFPESAGKGISVEVGEHVVPAMARPGGHGTWATVDLPAGRSDVVIRRGDTTDSIEVDTGDATAPALAGATGPDGPECAGAALGGLVAGARTPLTGCPADALASDDADALRRLVGALAANGTPAVTLEADDSPRSRQAADVVRAAAAERGVAVSPVPQPEGALVVVSGWERAVDRLTLGHQYVWGVHLAPWLLHGPVLNTAASSSVPLRFDPRDQRSLAYGLTLAGAFGGEPPSVAGFGSWLAARGMAVRGPVTIYAAAQVDVMKMSMPGMDHGGTAAGTWNPKGTVVAVSAPLAP